MFLYNLFFSAAVVLGQNRISSINKDLSKVQKINLSPGLVSVLEFPRPVIEVRVGNPNLVKVSVSAVSPKELTVYLAHGQGTATNLIVRAESRVYIFDIIPSRSTHQDYIKVSGSFGSPEQNPANRTLESISLAPVMAPASKIKAKSVIKVEL